VLSFDASANMWHLLLAHSFCLPKVHYKYLANFKGGGEVQSHPGLRRRKAKSTWWSVRVTVPLSCHPCIPSVLRPFLFSACFLLGSWSLAFLGFLHMIQV
jgi:hypothetical protein